MMTHFRSYKKTGAPTTAPVISNWDPTQRLFFENKQLLRADHVETDGPWTDSFVEYCADKLTGATYATYNSIINQNPNVTIDHCSNIGITKLKNSFTSSNPLEVLNPPKWTYNNAFDRMAFEWQAGNTPNIYSFWYLRRDTTTAQTDAAINDRRIRLSKLKQTIEGLRLYDIGNLVKSNEIMRCLTGYKGTVSKRGSGENILSQYKCGTEDQTLYSIQTMRHFIDVDRYQWGFYNFFNTTANYPCFCQNRTTYDVYTNASYTQTQYDKPQAAVFAGLQNMEVITHPNISTMKIYADCIIVLTTKTIQEVNILV